MEDNTLYSFLWFCALVVVLSIIFSVLNFNINNSNNATTLIKEGKDPILVGCALGTANIQSAGCAAISAVRKD